MATHAQTQNATNNHPNTTKHPPTQQTQIKTPPHNHPHPTTQQTNTQNTTPNHTNNKTKTPKTPISLGGGGGRPGTRPDSPYFVWVAPELYRSRAARLKTLQGYLFVDVRGSYIDAKRLFWCLGCLSALVFGCSLSAL